MKVLWVRGNEHIGFNRPSTWFCLGLRGTAKSSLLEHIGLNYMANNAVWFDLFGSRDGEGLAMLRAPEARDKEVLLIRGDNVDVKSSFNVKLAEQLTVSDTEKYDIIISASPLYLSPDQEFTSAATLTDVLYKRLHYKRLIYLLVREAANFYYSRLKVSENQVAAKANMIYLIREARHMGIALGLDSVRYYSIDIDIRSLTDYLILKSQGVQGLDSTLSWLYYFFNPTVIRSMAPQHFITICKTGTLGLGTFPYHSWHKEEKEDILNEVGISVEYGEVLKEAMDRGRYRTVSDKEHEQIIMFYLDQHMGMQAIAGEISRSSKTIHDHITMHDQAIARSSFCPSCRRVGSKLSQTLCMGS